MDMMSFISSHRRAARVAGAIEQSTFYRYRKISRSPSRCRSRQSDALVVEIYAGGRNGFTAMLARRPRFLSSTRGAGSIA